MSNSDPEEDFATLVCRCIHQSDEGSRWDVQAIYTLVGHDTAAARKFAQSRLIANDPHAIEEAAAVTVGYQMHTGDGSLWPTVVELASQYSYQLYELVSVLSPYHEVALWEEAPERGAAREHWLISNQEKAICDKCRAFLPRGAGFLVHIGVQNIDLHETFGGGQLQIDVGDALYCSKCFADIRKLPRRPLRMAEWGRVIGRDDSVRSFLYNEPPIETPASLLAKVRIEERALDSLMVWIRQRLALIPSTSTPHMDSWWSWVELLRLEAEHASKLHATDPRRALLLSRGVLLLSTLIRIPFMKMSVLFILRAYFRNSGNGFELTEVCSQLAAGSRYMLDEMSDNDNDRRVFGDGYVAALQELTEKLYHNRRYDEALIRSFEWLTQTMRTKGREAARKPRFLIAQVLFQLGNRKLSLRALENNGLIYLELPIDQVPLDAELWQQALFYGEVLKDEGLLADAIRVFSRLRDRVPETIGRFAIALLHSELGFTYGATGDTNNARNCLLVAASLAEETKQFDAAKHWRHLASQLQSIRTRIPGEPPGSESHASASEHTYAFFRPVADLFACGRWGEAIPLLHALANDARSTGNQLHLGTALLNLGVAYVRTDPPHMDTAYGYFNEGIRLADDRGEHHTRVVGRILFAEALFDRKFFDRCQDVLDDAIRVASELARLNPDTASRQEIVSSVFSAFELRVKLGACQGNWLEVVWFGEQTRARTLSRWLTISRFDDEQEPQLNKYFQCIRETEVEAEVRHLTRTGVGERLWQLVKDRDFARRMIDHQLMRAGRSPPDWEGLFRSWNPDAFRDELAEVIKPGVAVLFLFSARDRFHWVIGSRDSTNTEQLVLGGVRPCWEWNHTQRVAVAETVQRQFARPGRQLGLVPEDPSEDRPVDTKTPDTETSGINPLDKWNDLLLSVGDAIIKRRVKRLVVIPHRELALFPYWALVEQCKLEGFTMVPSLEVLLADCSRPNKTEGAAVIVSDTTSSLPCAQKEVEDVVSARRSHGGIVLATDYSSLLKHSQQCTLLHVAAHGHFHAANPYESGFPLSQVDDDRGFYARFTPHHKYAPSPEPVRGGYRVVTAASVMGQFSLDACRLVVLSACESGIPRMHDGGELVGLPNAFMLAGAKSIIASLWPVDDRATYLLMKYFYEAWAGGFGTEPSPAVALATARLQLQRTKRATALQLLGKLVDLPAGEVPFNHPAYTDAFNCHGGW
jgi:CHAT domain-containing protein/tetratricopeptide (TPR) repeat protein